jgi:hypothetical protein
MEVVFVVIDTMVGCSGELESGAEPSGRWESGMTLTGHPLFTSSSPFFLFSFFVYFPFSFPFSSLFIFHFSIFLLIWLFSFFSSSFIPVYLGLPLLFVFPYFPVFLVSFNKNKAYNNHI